MKLKLASYIHLRIKNEMSDLHYVRSFIIEDFDDSKDYHLNIEGYSNLL